MTIPEFQPFPKIYRLRRPIIVTEKIDGTNACVYVPEDTAAPLVAGSRTRWLGDGADNFGFAAWVREHEAELRTLGPGVHFGEWWGKGIQRGYGLDHKRFSLFNVSRWIDSHVDPKIILPGCESTAKVAPACCHVVPFLGMTGALDHDFVACTLEQLKVSGSFAARDFMRPEGVVVFHEPSGFLFKQTIEKDEEPKGARR